MAMEDTDPIIYPDETWGSEMARKIRIECNKLTPEERIRLQKVAQEIIEEYLNQKEN